MFPEFCGKVDNLKHAHFALVDLKFDSFLQEWPTFFEGPAQYIVEEFATRFGIESIFMAMT